MEHDGAPAIRVAGLRRCFLEGTREHVVLKDLDLRVRTGEMVAVRGRSGSGKSTLLNLIAGIDVPDAGMVMVAGIDITGLTEHDRTLFRRRHMGFVYQSFNLVPTLNVFDNVRLVLELNGITGKKAAQRGREILDAVDLADRGNSYPEVLSGGEQQRVAIARALCHGPDVLLADEPTGNLDDVSAGRVLDLLEELVHRNGRTLLIATHSMGIASRCDRVMELHNGQIQAAAPGLP